MKSHHPLPCIDDLFDPLKSARVFSKIDLTLGYHQLLVTRKEVPKTTFRTCYGTMSF